MNNWAVKFLLIDLMPATQWGARGVGQEQVGGGLPEGPSPRPRALRKASSGGSLDRPLTEPLGRWGLDKVGLEEAAGEGGEGGSPVEGPPGGGDSFC